MKILNSRIALRLGALVAVTSLIISVAAVQATAQVAPLSDELLITGLDATGMVVVVYDKLLPEGGGPGSEGALLFAPGSGLPDPLPPGALGGVASPLPGAFYVLLLEPIGFVPNPSELPPPVWIGPNNHDYYVSDVLVNGLANQVFAFPFVALISDDNPDLAAIVATLGPGTPFLPETGALQDLTALMGPNTLPGFGPVSVFVRSDVSVPEPSTILLASLAVAGLAVSSLRRRRHCKI